MKKTNKPDQKVYDDIAARYNAPVYLGPPEGYENVTLKVTAQENDRYMQLLQQMGAISIPAETFSSVCKFCGEAKLQWRKVDIGWRLFDNKNVQHTCEPF